ncbi:hypothetical protein HMPREF0083_01896 [Aneurinibacillus aneurinilyticus ATCC 12856]|uniref:Uncharacterized protein n=1 Tax=Aneurinibacillus aneurinilyticus ATCC 12856 TaxID=649747 RepID=U1YCZ0_ANEAE|nr:hypothetical protein HMPREF0083_01896 [Aneurinibacillus aneurinilyticus ATCC 12856]
MHASACSLVFSREETRPLLCGRRTDARLGNGVMTLPSGSYWIINTLDKEYMV